MVPCKGGCGVILIVPLGDEENAWCGNGNLCIREFPHPWSHQKKDNSEKGIRDGRIRLHTRYSETNRLLVS